MSDKKTSDKPTVKMKEHLNYQKTEKQRSYSVESLNFNSVTKNPTFAKDIQTISKTNNQTGEIEIPGSSEKYEDALINQKQSYEDIFKPSKTAFRSPPRAVEVFTEENCTNNLVEMNNKRYRSSTSPEQENLSKRQCDENNWLHDEDINTENEEVNENNSDCNLSEEMILNFFTTLDRLTEVIDGNKDQYGNISLSMNEYKVIKDVQFDISRLFTILVFKFGKIEKKVLQKIRLQQENVKPERSENKEIEKSTHRKEQ